MCIVYLCADSEQGVMFYEGEAYVGRLSGYFFVTEFSLFPSNMGFYVKQQNIFVIPQELYNGLVCLYID